MIFVACSQLFLFLWCSILSIWNEIQMCSWDCIADEIAGWSRFKKKKEENLTMRKISIWNVCFQSVCLNWSILSFYWAFWKVYFEIMRLHEVWGFWDTQKARLLLNGYNFLEVPLCYFILCLSEHYNPKILTWNIYNPWYQLINHLTLGKRERCSCLISAQKSCRIPGLICSLFAYKIGLNFALSSYSLCDLL